MQDLRLIGVHEDGQHLLLADADGGRFLATTTDADLMALLCDGEPLGANIVVTSTDEGNRAVPA